MEYRQFGRTGLKVSAIGFGCWEIGGTYGHIDEAQFQRAVKAAIEAGITCFDTAEAYGMGVSEEALARALAGRRSEVVIATKFGVGYEEMPNRRDSSRSRVFALDRQKPAATQDRPCRHLSRPLARSQYAPRRDDDSARRRRAAGQGALHRRVQLPPGADRRRRCGSVGSMSCNMPGICSTAACRPRSFRIARRSRSV